MKEVFQSYGKYYDIIYADKAYEKECDFLEEIFRKYSKFMPKTILDGGCGTGGHAVSLAKRGYNVTGIDASQTMINIAKEKARKNGVDIDFYVMSLQELNLNEKFDAVIAMFAVINYLTKNEDLKNAFINLRKVLRSESLLIFDFWYGPAVLTIKPSVRVKMVEGSSIKILRIVVPEMNTLEHVVKSHYDLIVMKKDRIIDEIRETHTLRYLFTQELLFYLKETGFRILEFCEFPKIGSPPTENTWNAAVIAKAV